MGRGDIIRVSSNMVFFIDHYMVEEGNLSAKAHRLMAEAMRVRVERAGDVIPQSLMTPDESAEYLENLRKLKILKLQREQEEVDAARLRTEEEAQAFKEKKLADEKAHAEEVTRKALEAKVREDLIAQQEKEYRTQFEYNRQRKTLDELVTVIEVEVEKMEVLMPLFDAMPESINSDSELAKIEAAEKRAEEKRRAEEADRLYWEEHRRKQSEYYKEHPTDPDWAKKATPPPKKSWRPW